MPFSTLASLPKSIRDSLPVGAQRIFRAAVNTALNSGKTEEQAFKIAWGAVKAQYRRAEDLWVKKTLETPTFIQGAIISRENLSSIKKPKKRKK